MSDEIRNFCAFQITIDKTPIKWSGTVDVKSNFKNDYHYFTSSKDSLIDAINEAVERYGHIGIRGIDIKEHKEQE